MLRTRIILLTLLGIVVACGKSSSSPRTPAATAPVITTEGPAALRCDDTIDAVDQLPSTYSELLGFVALAVPRDGKGNHIDKRGERSFFAKTGLLVRAGTTFDLVAPPGSSLRFEWGHEHNRTNALHIENCPGTKSWVVFAGGFWVEAPGCYDIIVRSDGREHRVSLPLGADCR